MLFVFKEDQSITDQIINMSLPDNIVPRSSRVYVSITGDAIGPVLDNLDNLVQQPTGCGEQNMVKFAPIVSISNYLTQTYQMSAKMSNLIQEYLKIGYQRQLIFRHKDGSFSAFGPSNSNESGGTWLTAFVLRCFADTYASKQIPIDSEDIKLSLEMLIKTQNREGAFTQVGAALYSKALAGGLKDKKTALSAYVTISILKSIQALNLTDAHSDAVGKGVTYLKNSIKDLSSTDTYTLALVHYVLKLTKTNDQLFKDIGLELDARAIIEGKKLF